MSEGSVKSSIKKEKAILPQSTQRNPGNEIKAEHQGKCMSKPVNTKRKIGKKLMH
jgi:hypothetical protein